MPGKNYLEYSYTYRLSNKVIRKLKLKYSRSYFDYLKSCEDNNSNNYANKDELLHNYYNEEIYEQDKSISTHFEKAYGNKPEDINTFPMFSRMEKK